ncbi:thioredoxin family protein [Anaerotignum sp. MB30-C6]|uniref:thioredoxin family protein n=1 Tax=Anaerotignum sp. MB30-C6 TaxID=3070814 RepID=UPI0027DB79F2|nr:thioredoxin family protein [Anaerotignum sp. MB30-C6]WMI79943.1 thioredoxin family protein [Anaerotignum sp. MB30-C6]
MGLFRRKKEVKTCSCGGNCNPEMKELGEMNKSGNAAIKVLGSGCTKCNQLEAAAKEALLELGVDTAIDHVTDFAQIANYGVMTTPALVVDGKVVSYGKVLKKEEIVDLLKQNGVN